jgi:hypothetical protein
MNPEDLEKEIENIPKLTAEELESDLGLILQCFMYSDLKGGARNIAVRYNWVATYVFRTNTDKPTRYVFNALLNLLKSRNDAIYAYLEREQCFCD